MSDIHETAARALRQAYSGGPIAPMRQWLDPVDAEGAYAVQAINTRFWQAEGRRIVGRKAGLTAKAVQVQLGVDQPDFGVLFDDMRVTDGGVLEPARCLQPKAEAEIAFVLGQDLPDPHTSADMVAQAVATVHAAIEIDHPRLKAFAPQLDLDSLHESLVKGLQKRIEPDRPEEEVAELMNSEQQSWINAAIGEDDSEDDELDLDEDLEDETDAVGGADFGSAGSFADDVDTKD